MGELRNYDAASFDGRIENIQTDNKWARLVRGRLGKEWGHSVSASGSNRYFHPNSRID